jgi:integrase
VMHLSWSQVDFQNNTVFIHRKKGGLDTTLQMSQRLRSMLERRKQLAINDFVFPTKINARNAYKWFQNAA